MEPAVLGKVLDHIEQQEKDVHSLLIVRNGYLVLEWYSHPYSLDKKHILNSCTKSFLSTLVGLAIDKGYVQNENNAVMNYFPEYRSDKHDETKQRITIRHLLTMSSGLDWPQYGPNNASDRMGESDDWVKFILSRPMAAEPGSQTNYSNGDSHLLSAILQQVTGATALDFGRKWLFGPLGITDTHWDRDPQGISIGSAALYLTPRDAAKLGQLYLNHGLWEGRMVVSPGWVDASVQSHTRMPTTGGPADYGYYWWVYPERGLYEAWGGAGQRIGVFPAHSLAVVMTADIGDDVPRSPFAAAIYRSICESVTAQGPA